MNKSFGWIILLVAFVASCALSVCSAPDLRADGQTRKVLILLYPDEESKFDKEKNEELSRAPEKMLERFAESRELSIGWLSATQGRYTEGQALLDLTSGSRISRGGFNPADVPPFGLVKRNGGWWISYWQDVVKRAESAPARLIPGLLASSIQGGVGYVGIDRDPGSNRTLARMYGRGVQEGDIKGRSKDSRRSEQIPAMAYMGGSDAVIAADRQGHIDEVSLGASASIIERTNQVLSRHSLVVVTVPPGNPGMRIMENLVRNRPKNELLIAMQRPPRYQGKRIIPIAVAGLKQESQAGKKDGEAGLLYSRTSRRAGLVTGIDILPTVLTWLGRPIPKGVHGRMMSIKGERNIDDLEALRSRFAVVRGRNKPSMGATLLVGALVGIGLIGIFGRSGFRGWLRTGSLAMMWMPTVGLITAAIEPNYWQELLMIGAGSTLLGLVTDRFVRWPYGPMLPAFIGVGAYVVDLFNNSDLIVRSVLGPNPGYGARFFGLGNELEVTLPVLMMVGLGAALCNMKRSPRLAALFCIPMLILTLITAAGHLGAAVGGIFTAGVGATVAVLFCLTAKPTWKAVLAIIGVPAIGLIVLAAIDLSTGGDAHFTNTVLAVTQPSELAEIARRRFGLAWAELWRDSMPYQTLVATVATIIGLKFRRYLYAPIAEMPSWNAALIGGVFAGVVGSLANDSGPVLLVYGTGVLIAATVYIRGNPVLAERLSKKDLISDSSTQGLVDTKPQPEPVS